ncbi:unnamed protein product [Fraxinus pennsylvanica]|uniref:Reverse transcriptase Ty1/copia-type domain-containing protein n=1 Tax=Fraxinus pennsylvanica TaxID=56036 RepID=A0AAD2DNW8_9LAMI|nr:unnamed protein product [Fraxinus pennsylvanica]
MVSWLVIVEMQKDIEFEILKPTRLFPAEMLKLMRTLHGTRSFTKEGEEDKVYLLKKALYDLKQAPRSWYSRIDSHLSSLGFNKSVNEQTLYIKPVEEDLLIILLYIDDLLITGSNAALIDEIKDELKTDFEMTDLGEMKYFLGMEVNQTEDAQNSKLIKDDGAKKTEEKVYRSLVGCLLYLTATRPDLMFAINLLSRFSQEPSEIHFQVAKRVLSDWAGSANDMKSTSSYTFYNGSSLVCWNSIKQKMVAQSTAEAEYIEQLRQLIKQFG